MTESCVIWSIDENEKKAFVTSSKPGFLNEHRASSSNGITRWEYRKDGVLNDVKRRPALVHYELCCGDEYSIHVSYKNGQKVSKSNRYSVESCLEPLPLPQEYDTIYQERTGHVVVNDQGQHVFTPEDDVQDEIEELEDEIADLQRKLKELLDKRKTSTPMVIPNPFQ